MKCWQIKRYCFAVKGLNCGNGKKLCDSYSSICVIICGIEGKVCLVSLYIPGFGVYALDIQSTRTETTLPYTCGIGYFIAADGLVIRKPCSSLLIPCIFVKL